MVKSSRGSTFLNIYGWFFLSLVLFATGVYYYSFVHCVINYCEMEGLAILFFALLAALLMSVLLAGLIVAHVKKISLSRILINVLSYVSVCLLVINCILLIYSQWNAIATGRYDYAAFLFSVRWFVPLIATNAFLAYYSRKLLK